MTVRSAWLTESVGARPGATSADGSALLACAAGDRLALYGLQNPGAAVTALGGSGHATSLTAEWIRS